MATTKRNGVPWDADAVSDKSMSSLDVLLEWLTDANNYTRWRAGSKKKATSQTGTAPGSRGLPVVASKEKLCQEILAKLHAHGLSHRTSHEVRSKINDLERSHRAAVDWKSSTGAGVGDDDQDLVEATVLAKILKLCKHFDVLDAVMGDRPAARPIYTNEDEEKGSEHEIGDGVDSDDNDTDSLDADSLPVLRSLPHSEHAVPPPPQPRSPSNTPAKRPPTVLEMWKEMAESTASVDQDRADIEKGKLRIEAKRLRLDEEKMKWDIELRRIQVLKERALAKIELKKAGISEEEVSALFD